jgi:hypothetical protein
MTKYEDDLIANDVVDFEAVMQEVIEHEVLVGATKLIHKYGLLRVLLSLRDYTSEPVACYALGVMAEMYKENEHVFCKDAPTMQ